MGGEPGFRKCKTQVCRKARAFSLVVKNMEISADVSSLFDIHQGFLIKSIFLKLSVMRRKLFLQQLYNILIIKFKLF